MRQRKTVMPCKSSAASPQPRDHRIARGVVPALLDWFAAQARDLPWRRTRDPYAIWISEIMLQQTQVKTVIPYWERWMKSLPTLDSLAAAPPDRLHKLWEGLGYYTRVRNLQRAAREIVQQHDGRFPTRFEDVLALPGVGRYTAGAICSIAFNQPTPIVDGNVTRVLCRLWALDRDPRQRPVRDELWALAAALVRQASGEAPRELHLGLRLGNSAVLNQSLMELGAVVCTPRQPVCASCPVARWCLARRSGRQDELPAKPTRPATTQKRVWVFVIARRGRFLVRQRPGGVVNGHLWEFPNLEVTAGERKVASVAKRVLGFVPRKLEPFATVRHTITRHRITVEAFRGEAGAGAWFPSSGSWVGRDELAARAFPSAHSRLRRLL